LGVCPGKQIMIVLPKEKDVVLSAWTQSFNSMYRASSLDVHHTKDLVGVNFCFHFEKDRILLF